MLVAVCEQSQDRPNGANQEVLVTQTPRGVEGTAGSVAIEIEQIERVPSQSRAEAAADELVKVIKQLEPGARLGSKDELRERLGVSLGTFNQTLRILQATGMVTVRRGPSGGLFAAEQTPMVRLGNAVLGMDIDDDAYSEAFRIRLVLEPLIIEDAVAHAKDTHIEQMRGELAAMLVAVRQEDGLAFVRSNWRLHEIIAEASPHPILRSIYLSVLELIENRTVSIQSAPGASLTPFHDERYLIHAELVDAIASKNSELAADVIARHNQQLAVAADASL